MRVVGGRYKGVKLVAPSGANTRPTTDGQRETIFNVLINGMGHQPRAVLDLFAGTGALSLEALSRGAQSAVLIESDKNAKKCIERNFLQALQSNENRPDYCLITEADPRRWPKQLISPQCAGMLPFDTIFCDPPYSKGWIHKAFDALEFVATQLYVAEQTVLVCEMSSQEALPTLNVHWKLLNERSRGATKLAFYSRS